jgi:hypothetical protein
MFDAIIREAGFKVSTAKDLTAAVLANGSLTSYVRVPDKYNNYRLISNNVDFFWGAVALNKNTLLISCKGTELVNIESANCQLVVEYLTKFEGLSKKEIEEFAIEAQEDSKTQLIIEIRDLQKEKKILLDEVVILRQIEEKKEELKRLLTKLND